MRFLNSALLTPVLAAALLLPACATAPAPVRAPGPVAGGQIPTPPAPVIVAPDAPEQQIPDEKPDETTPPPPVTRDGLTPPHMAGRDIKRLALLLPFSSQNARLREEASAMLQAAEMAVFDRDESDVLLIALDTAGTADGAKSATKAALDSGVDVVLGPLLAPNVKAAGSEARRKRTPVIAFSTDQSVAGNGVYLLSFPPEAEVDRITAYAVSNGARNFAFLGPDSAYGRRVKAAYQRAARNYGASVTHIETYQGNDISVMQEPARKIADAYKAAQEQGQTAFDAILLPEGGTALRSLGPLLPYYDINPARVQFMGTGLWNREEVALEPALRGGIFAANDQAAYSEFAGGFTATYNKEPSRLSSLAYDAVNIGAIIADGQPNGRTERTIDPSGFYGVDGFVRFRRDGTPERGLAIYQVRPNRFDVIDPAPKTAEDISF